MPEPIQEAGQSTQTEQIASTPAPSVGPDQPTTVKTSETSGSSGKSLMDLLDIPPEVQSRLGGGTAKAEQEQPELPIEQRPEGRPSPGEEQRPEGRPSPPEEPEELASDEEEGEEEEEPPTAEAGATEKVDKRQKRINRLTRKKAELESQLDAVAAENYKLREAIQKGQGQPLENQVAPLTGQNLSAIQSEIARCDATLEWCDNNAEGTEIGEGDKTQYYDAKAIRAWRRDSEVKRQKAVVAEEKELERLAFVRQQADQQAVALWPEMFDKSKPEYQEAVSIIRKYPFITAIPEANYALGLFIEAGRSMKAKAAKNPASVAGQKQHRDIDERVFTTPRVPIAPHTPEPSSRESKPSSQKQLNEAMSRLTKDVDGSAESLTNVFAAMENAQKTRASSRSPVRS